MKTSLKTLAVMAVVIGVSAIGAADQALAHGGNGGRGAMSGGKTSMGSHRGQGNRDSHHKFDKRNDRKRDYRWDRYDFRRFPGCYESSYRYPSCYQDYCRPYFVACYTPSYCCQYVPQYCVPEPVAECPPPQPVVECPAPQPVCEEPVCEQPCYPVVPEYCGTECYGSYDGYRCPPWWDKHYDRKKKDDGRPNRGHGPVVRPLNGAAKGISGSHSAGKLAGGMSGGSRGSRR